MASSRRVVVLVLGLCIFGFAAGAEAIEALAINRLDGEIELDGRLSDPGWEKALVVEDFFEYRKSDNGNPPVTTVAYLAYDTSYLYVAFKSYDPEPSRIRAPFVDRDGVSGDQDWVGVMLDTQDDRRSAMVFRVNPRGIQADAMRNDANGNEDFSPDFFFDAIATPTEYGWVAEMRIPMSTLRYPDKENQSWGLILQRNYPRDFSYVMASVPVPRSANCLICHAASVEGLEKLPSANHLTIAPYVTATGGEALADSDDLGSGLEDQGISSELGLDLKWQPNARLAIDATVNPDFSQVESDVAEITVNNRFAIAFPEKRTFFLEGTDLFSTPINAVHTRTITSPTWGTRATGQIGSSAYTLLVSHDRGGGTVVLPDTLSSEFADQDFESTAVIGRLRRSIGESFAGLLLTSREIDGGGYNRTFGPDFQWRPTSKDRVTGQFLYSWTENPDRPDLSEQFDGRSFSGFGARLSWNHKTDRYDTWMNFDDRETGFRADNGFVPQVGVRKLNTGIGWSFFPEGRAVSYLKPRIGTYRTEDRAGDVVVTSPYVGIYFRGRWNSSGWIGTDPRIRERIGDEILEYQTYWWNLTASPNRRIPEISVGGRFGGRVDYANDRIGNGGDLNISASIRPTDHLDVQLRSRTQWLDVLAERSSEGGRLFTAEVQRIRATYTFTSRSLIRLIGERQNIERNPSLYLDDVDARSGGFAVSALYGYKLNWQTVFFVGYGDSNSLDESEAWQPTDRSLFMKISYAFQR